MRIGLIIPPADGTTPRECLELYPGIEFVTVGLGVKEMSRAGFEEVADQILHRARTLQLLGVHAISVMGTSLTFYRGGAYNDELIKLVAGETHLPATSMSTSVIRALKASRIANIALATAYTPELNDRLSEFLANHGVRTTSAVGLGLTDINAVRPTSPRAVRDAAEEAFEKGPSADGLLLSCGGMPTLQLHSPLEEKFGIPVVSSLAAGLWDVVQLSGCDPRVPGFGRLFTVTGHAAGNTAVSRTQQGT